MPRFDVYTNATVKQGLRYGVTAPTPEEALRKVLETDLGSDDEIKVTEEECILETLDWVWDQEGNDVTPTAIIGSD